jgi:penicillin-binding protein 1A
MLKSLCLKERRTVLVPQSASQLHQTGTAKWFKWGVYSLFVLASSAIGAFAGLAAVYSIDLPQVQDLKSYRPISNTLLFDDVGRVFASFALQRRTIAQYKDYPKLLYDAVLSIEDKNFEKHPGFEPTRVLSAAYHDLVSREHVQGASTLTMQLARNLFLSSERTYSRKIRELIVAVQIEHYFSKSQIFTLYGNQIYLGHGVYGFATGAEFYFGKRLQELSLEEAALLAALPKAPNSYSPLKNPERALWRRNLVINSMLAAGRISAADAAAAKNKPIQLHLQGDPNSLAPHFVEELRQYLERKYGTDQVHERGLRVYTTLNIDLQRAANHAVMDGLAAYERRHGWRAGKSEVQGALLAIDNASGEVKAMVGGRDFKQSKFNRATQALRQVGSSFKPYVYTAAIDQGAMPDDTVVDAPIAFMTASGPWIPHNYDEKFEGVITLRHALAESRNIPAVKLARRLGMKKVIDYARRFGIRERIPAYLPVALGAVELTLAEHTSAFSAFPNDGIRVIPRYVRKVTDYDGRVLEQNYPNVEDAIGQRTARIMVSMLREVVLHGTAVGANRMKVPVAGKTGTTNDFTDAWFIGFSPSITCGVWIGFDEKKSLGNKETGARAALPVWMDFMSVAIVKTDSGRDFLRMPEETDRVLTRQGDQGLPPPLVRQLAEQRAVISQDTGVAIGSVSRQDLDPATNKNGPER